MNGSFSFACLIFEKVVITLIGTLRDSVILRNNKYTSGQHSDVYEVCAGVQVVGPLAGSIRCFWGTLCLTRVDLISRGCLQKYGSLTALLTSSSNNYVVGFHLDFRLLGLVAL